MNPLTDYSKKFAAYLRYGDKLNPLRDWLILLGISAVLMIGIIAWNVWAFSTVVSGGTISKTMSTPIAPVNLSSLESIQKIFTARKEWQDMYLTGAHHFVDPSK